MTNDDSYEISKEPPRDGQGHPIHPEKGYRICGAQKSDRSTPAPHGRSRDDIEYCLQRAGWGCDRDIGPCRNHPISGEQWGESNPNYSSGAYSTFREFMFDSATEKEREALEALDFDENAAAFAKDVVKNAWLKYHRTGDDRFLREARQWASKFGVIEAVPDKLEIDGDLSLSPGEKEQLDEMLDGEPQT